MTKTYEWSALRNRAAEVFGEQPNAELEAELLPVFQSKPEAMVQVLKGAADAVRAGRVQKGWALVRTEIRALVAPGAVATGAEEREEKLARVRAGALAWVKNVGPLYDDEAAVVSELFGDHGRFKRWPALESEVLEEWRHARVAPE